MPIAYRHRGAHTRVVSKRQVTSYSKLYDKETKSSYWQQTNQYSTDQIGFISPMRYSSGKQKGDRRNATPYAAVTVNTGYVAGGWSTKTGYNGQGSYSTIVGEAMPSPMANVGLFGISPSSASRGLAVPSDDVAWARTTAASKVVGAEFSLLTTLAELKSTVNGIADIARKLALSAASLKRGRFKAALRHLGYSPRDVSALRNKAKVDLSDRAKALADTVGEAHLAYRYGILPLVYDFESLRRLWTKGVNVTHFYTVKGTTARSKKQKSGSGQDVFTVVDKYTVRFKACYAVDTHRLAMLSLLGATDLLGTLWELTPWSFVVDWGLNVGDFLRGLQGPLGMYYVGGHVSVRGTTTLSYTQPASNAYTTWHRPDTECDGYIRQALGNPSVSLRFSNPFENDTNITTSLALINQKMR